MTDQRFPVYHSKGLKACKKIAFYTTKRWKKGELMKSAEGILIDGSAPAGKSPILCGSCRRRLAPTHLSYNEDGSN
jgi:hypothetical protein